MADFWELKGITERVKFGDEFHYLFECSYFEDQRRMYIPRVLSTTLTPLNLELL